MDIPFRKRIVASRWAVRRVSYEGERVIGERVNGEGKVIRGLKIHIWDSECRERSAKRMV